MHLTCHREPQHPQQMSVRKGSVRNTPFPVTTPGITDSNSDHWAFQPVVDPSLPRVQAENWCRDGLDHLILARLEEAGIRPNPDADGSVLLRRVTIDPTDLHHASGNASVQEPAPLWFMHGVRCFKCPEMISGGLGLCAQCPRKPTEQD